MFGSNQIRSNEIHCPIDIIWFGNNNIFLFSIGSSALAMQCGCGLWIEPKSESRCIHSYSSADTYSIDCVRFDVYIRPLCFAFSLSPLFSHVISLLTRIYFLNRSVLQFAICFQYEKRSWSNPCLYVSTDALLVILTLSHTKHSQFNYFHHWHIFSMLICSVWVRMILSNLVWQRNAFG